ncbi:glycoside hydrolase family 71 protein [Trametes elegans]|nr:glycoside hydrolase family 71 protein [Trametes elegans]
MVGNTFVSLCDQSSSCRTYGCAGPQPYSLEDWKEDIKLASSHEIDAFALNIGGEAWQKNSVANCYAAALESGVQFNLYLNFDLSVLPGDRREDVARLREYVAMIAGHPSQLLYGDRILVGTFAGQNKLFGCATLAEACKFVKDSLEAVAPVHLIPSYFINPCLYLSMPAMDGYFNWNGSWPIHLTPHSSRGEIQSLKLDTDKHHIHHLGGRTFMAAVSPWFFSHYGPDSWNKNWIYRGDDWLYVRRWEQLIAMRDQVDIVQIISWNDYGESHYIGPIKGAQPNSQAWVDGFPHTAWLDLTRYYACAFKTGAYPPIERDRIYMWARPHPRDAEAVDDPVGRPDGWQLTDDIIWIVVFATDVVEVHVCGDDGKPPAQKWLVGKGVWKLSHPMATGNGMRAQLIREDAVVAECAPSRDEFVVQERPRTYNFNAFVAMSP